MFTLSQLQTLKEKGLIKDFTHPTKAKEGQLIAPQGKAKRNEAGAKNKEWLHLNLKAWCDAHKLLLIREHTFSDERGWRFDWAVFNGTEKVVAIEYEGVYSKKSRHTTQSGYTEDTNKYREAGLQGWKVLRYTAKNYENILKDLEILNKAS